MAQIGWFGGKAARAMRGARRGQGLALTCVGIVLGGLGLGACGDDEGDGPTPIDCSAYRSLAEAACQNGCYCNGHNGESGCSVRMSAEGAPEGFTPVELAEGSNRRACADIVQEELCLRRADVDLCGELIEAEVQRIGDGVCEGGYEVPEWCWRECEGSVVNGRCQPPLGIGTSCPLGDECEGLAACPDGTPCGPGQPGACSDAECRPLRCLTAGEGDANAYCTLDHCQSDEACGDGRWCGISRSNQRICGTQKGSEQPCIEPADFNANGQTFQEGPTSLLFNTCLVRRDCAPCEDDVDCSGVPGQLCASIGGESRCAGRCASDADCPPDLACVDDPAHAGTTVCAPRFGSCSGSGDFCEPCVNDLDCGDANGTSACIGTGFNRRACFDTSFSVDCLTDFDCPQSPSGSHGLCLDQRIGVSPSDTVFHKCYLPYSDINDPPPNGFLCWFGPDGCDAATCTVAQAECRGATACAGNRCGRVPLALGSECELSSGDDGVCNAVGTCLGCNDDDDCEGGVCTDENTCVECIDHDDCGALYCNGESACVECLNASHCTDQVCSPAGACVECNETEDCGTEETCVASVCVPN